MRIASRLEVPATSKSSLRLFIVALITASFVCAVWQGSARGDVSALGALNGDRANAGVPPLAESASLDNLAMRHTREMASSGSLYHSSDLSGAMQSAEPGWTRAGENVGVGPSVEAIEAAFMRSTGHRDNIVGDFSRAGTAVVTGADGRVWVTQEFALVAATQTVRAAAAVPGAASRAPGGAGAVAGTTGPPDPPAKLAIACVTDPGGGYWAVAPNGGVFSFKGSTFFGSAGANHLAGSIVGAESGPTGQGYFLASDDGGVFGYGDAHFRGSMAGIPLRRPIVGIARSSNGYWLAAADGGIFSFDAPFMGSAAGLALHAPVVGLTSTSTGGGYWLATADGGIFAFGDAPFAGSASGIPLNAPIVGVAARPSKQGYWLVGADGAVFAIGDAHFYGSAASAPLSAPVSGICATATGNGYWLVAADGAVFAFGDAVYGGGINNLAPSTHAPAQS